MIQSFDVKVPCTPASNGRYYSIDRLIVNSYEDKNTKYFDFAIDGIS